MTAVILLALQRECQQPTIDNVSLCPYLAVLHAEIMINSSIKPSLTSPVAVDWRMKTSSSRTDSPTVKEVSWFE